MAKFFLSYNWVDLAWAEWVQRELLNLGHEVHNHRYDAAGGVDFSAWMNEQLDWADFTLALYSPDYLTGKWSVREIEKAFMLGTDTGRSCLLIAAVRPCEFKSAYRDIHRANLFAKFEDDARAELSAYLTRSGCSPQLSALPTVQSPPFPGRVPHNLPFSLSRAYFKRDQAWLFGREQLIGDLQKSLSNDHACRNAVILCGLPGCGKTIIAAAYAHALIERYRTCWWIRAADPESARADLAGLALQLRWVERERIDKLPVDSILEQIRLHGRDLLLIYDNAVDHESIAPLLPEDGDAHIIITSNARNWSAIGIQHEVYSWPSKTAGEFLLRRVPADEVERQVAEDLSEEMGGLPLALEMAGSYCAEHAMTLRHYAALFDRKLEIFGRRELASRIYHGHRTAAAAFEIAAKAANDRNPAARQALCYMALLAPDPIPLYLFEDGIKEFPNSFRQRLNKSGLDGVVRALSRFSLLERPAHDEAGGSDPGTEFVRLHRLVRLIVAAGLSEKKRESLRGDLIAVLAAAYPHDGWDFARAWPRTRELQAHAVSLLGAGPLPPEGRELAASDLLHQIALHSGASWDDPKRALDFAAKALEIRRRILPGDDLRIAASMTLLALQKISDKACDDEGEARDLASEAVKMTERLLGPEDRRVAVALVHLARVLRDTRPVKPDFGRFDEGLLNEAEEHTRRAIEIFGTRKDDADLALALTVRGRVLAALKRMGAARSAIEDALDLYKALYGATHPGRASNLLNLAETFTYEDGAEALQNARDWVERAREIYRAMMGEGAAALADCDGIQAVIELRLGRRDEGISLLERSLAISRRVLGNDHSVTRARRMQIDALRENGGVLLPEEQLGGLHANQHLGIA